MHFKPSYSQTFIEMVSLSSRYGNFINPFMYEIFNFIKIFSEFKILTVAL